MEYLGELSRLPSLFQGLSRQEAELLLQSLSPHREKYPRGAFLLRQGEPAGAMGLVLTGSVHIQREDFWGNRSILAQVGPGQLFGESYACLPSRPMEVAVVAAEPCQILLLSPKSLFTPLPQPEVEALRLNLCSSLLRVLAQRNLLLTRKMEHLTQPTTRQKVLSYLSAQSQEAGNPEFTIPFDRQQLADYLNVERSALSKELGRMRNEGILTFRKNHFQLHRTVER